MKKRIPDEDEVWVRKRFSFARHDEEEKWLEEMAGKGLELSRVYINGYMFKQCKPRTIHFMIDFLSNTDKANERVIERYNQAHEGWTYISSSLGRDYFRCGEAICPERKHYDIDKFIIDEKIVSRHMIIRRIPLLAFTIAITILAITLRSYLRLGYIVPLVLFIFGTLGTIFRDVKVRRAWYVLGLKRMLKRGEII